VPPCCPARPQSCLATLQAALETERALSSGLQADVDALTKQVGALEELLSATRLQGGVWKTLLRKQVNANQRLKETKRGRTHCLRNKVQLLSKMMQRERKAHAQLLKRLLKKHPKLRKALEQAQQVDAWKHRKHSDPLPGMHCGGNGDDLEHTREREAPYEEIMQL
jgi:chromosome segregation ATPase